MISKELLSLVLKMEVNHIPQQTSSKHIEFYSKTICNYYELMGDYSTVHGYLQRINVYELAHMCKEYAKSYDYYIESVVFEYGSRAFIHRKYDEDPLQILNDKTEPAVIFKAAEYIMQNLK